MDHLRTMDRLRTITEWTLLLVCFGIYAFGVVQFMRLIVPYLLWMDR